MSHPQDHFSAIADVYHNGRITYPTALYEYLGGLCERKELAWDCATGSGQAANHLAIYFNQIIATDISDSLLSHAMRTKNIEFRRASAEESGIETDSLDLITVAQAVHWFAFDEFWKEAKRVMKPNGILAFWGYVWPIVNDQIDTLLNSFRDVIFDSWPEKNLYLQDQYDGIEAPLKRVENPKFWITEAWTAKDYLNHLSSWSGTRYYHESSGVDPISEIRDELLSLWGNGHRKVSWPLILKVYRNT